MSLKRGMELNISPEVESGSSSNEGQPECRHRARFRILFILLAFVLIEITSKAILFANIHDVLNCDSCSEAHRISWVRAKAGLSIMGMDQGDESEYFMPKLIDQYDELLGWRPKSDLKLTQGNKRISTNSAGIRGTQEVSLEKTKPRIVFLGDSFTFGEDVSDEETYPFILSEILPEFEVLNFGVHGYGHDQMLLRLREEALSYDPDMVILGFVATDMSRNILSFRDYAKPLFHIAESRLTIGNTPIPTPRRLLLTEPLRIHSLDLALILTERLKEKSGRTFEDMKAITAALICEMCDVCTAQGVPFLMVNLPWGKYVSSDVPSERERFFESLAQDEGIPAFNLRPYFQEAYRQGLRPGEGHWRPIGHSFAAHTLAKHLPSVLENDEEKASFSYPL